MGPFVVTERIGNEAYNLDMLQCAALRGVHNVFSCIIALRLI